MNIRDITYETARQFSEIAASQHWIEQRMVEIKDALNGQRDYFDLVVKQIGIVVEIEKKKKRRKTKKKPQKTKHRSIKAKFRGIEVKKPK